MRCLLKKNRKGGKGGRKKNERGNREKKQVLLSESWGVPSTSIWQGVCAHWLLGSLHSSRRGVAAQAQLLWQWTGTLVGDWALGRRCRTLNKIPAKITVVGWIREAGLEAGILGRSKAGRDEAGRGLGRNTGRQNR